jgi:hypothetical protein
VSARGKDKMLFRAKSVNFTNLCMWSRLCMEDAPVIGDLSLLARDLEHVPDKSTYGKSRLGC